MNVPPNLRPSLTNENCSRCMYLQGWKCRRHGYNLIQTPFGKINRCDSYKNIEMNEEGASDKEDVLPIEVSLPDAF